MSRARLWPAMRGIATLGVLIATSTTEAQREPASLGPAGVPDMAPTPKSVYVFAGSDQFR